jgi:hypothetical protein
VNGDSQIQAHSLLPLCTECGYASLATKTRAPEDKAVRPESGLPVCRLSDCPE